MAKLSARGRKKWVHASREVGPIREHLAYMSDGIVLRKAGEDGWKLHGRWDRARTSLPGLRARLIVDGWTIVSGDGPRAQAVAS